MPGIGVWRWTDPSVVAFLREEASGPVTVTDERTGASCRFDAGAEMATLPVEPQATDMEVHLEVGGAVHRIKLSWPEPEPRPAPEQKPKSRRRRAA
jgi:hypothetical protein